MEVFRIVLDTNTYQSFLPVNDAIWKEKRLRMDCTAKAADWDAPEVYIHNPILKRGNFFRLCSGAFAVDQIAFEKLEGVLEWAGELLPFTHLGVPFWLVNVLECVNCLNDSETEWIIGKTTGARIGIRKYAFYKQRFSESTLFKIPERAAGEVLTLSGIKDAEDEFKTIVENEGLKGIMFQNIWSDPPL
jgi:hypothetical protein